MEHIFSAWDGISKELEKRCAYLFLDFDGTLASIADTPDRAVIPPKTQELLRALARSAKLKLAIISGRALSDIKAIVGIGGIIYVGNHGLEIEGAGLTSEWKMAPGYKDSLADIKARLSEECAALPGVFIEDKGLSLCLHYRMARVDEERVRVAFRRATGPYEASGTIVTLHGKKVIEVRPAAGWGKGKIVKWLLARERLAARDENIIAVYVGDDETDEDAFKALGDGGISVRVGNDAPSSAQYYVDDTDQVYELLARILKTGNA